LGKLVLWSLWQTWDWRVKRIGMENGRDCKMLEKFWMGRGVQWLVEEDEGYVSERGGG
jgi:hypothetical protein